MSKADATPKVKNPHPLMQQGTPPRDIESDHISMITVFRLGGPGAPRHVETISNPAQVTEPGALRTLVGGGEYQVKALANYHTSGRQQNSVIETTNFAFDGPPNVKATPAAQAPVATAPSLIEQTSSQLPALAAALGSIGTMALAFMSEARQARAAEAAKHREYEDAKIAREKEERERREAKDRQEAEERREKERVREEERRERERADAEERRAERERVEQLRADQARADSEARQAREAVMLNALMNRKDPNEALIPLLLQKALATPPPATPQAQAPSVDQMIATMQKLKDLTEEGPEKIIAAMMPLAGTPVGQVMLARLGNIANLCPRPEEMGLSAPVVPPEPAPVPQIAEQATPPMPPAPSPPMQEIPAGPVSIN